MTKTDFNYRTVIPRTLDVMSKPGLLLASCDADGKANAMTIGWGNIGIVWGKPVFEVWVRPSRYTYDLIEATGDFTVNVPAPGMDDAVMLCGTKSGRSMDKLAEAGLTAAPARETTSPVIEQCALHFECRVLHKTDMVRDQLAPSVDSQFYKGSDYHRLYQGLIVACYGERDFA